MAEVWVRAVTSAGGWVRADPFLKKIILHDAGSFVYQQPQFIKFRFNFVIIGHEKIIRQIPAFRKVKIIHPVVFCKLNLRSK
jgi:hypothetical protein